MRHRNAIFQVRIPAETTWRFFGERGPGRRRWAFFMKSSATRQKTTMRSGNRADPSQRSSRAKSGLSNAIPPVCRRLMPACCGRRTSCCTSAPSAPPWPKRCRPDCMPRSCPQPRGGPVISARARHFAADGWSVLQLIERRDGREQLAQFAAAYPDRSAGGAPPGPRRLAQGQGQRQGQIFTANGLAG